MFIAVNPCLKPDLPQHVSSQQVVLILEDADGGDGRFLTEAVGLPALIPAPALPQVDAEDLPRSATTEQHRNLKIRGEVDLFLRYSPSAWFIYNKPCFH